MSTQIEAWRVEAYKRNVIMLSQQKGSRLQMTCNVDGDVIGKRCYFDRIGLTEPQQMTSRHADTPLMDTPHTRRSATMADYNWADLVDRVDKLKIINDPTSPYAQVAVSAFGRKKDDVIISAMLGTAETGEDGSGSQTLPAGQKIAHGGTGLTLAKLIEANKLLDAAEVDPDLPRYFATNAAGIEDLLNDTTITSADYNTVKALVAGDIDTFMGFKFIRTERLTLDSNSDRQNIAFAQGAVGLALPEDVIVKISERDDKNYSTQVYVEMSLGAVRVEDERVVEVAVNE